MRGWSRALILRVVFVYALFSILWIVFTDRFLALGVSDPTLWNQIQTLKGLLFVLLSAAFLGFVLNRELKETHRAEQALRETEQRYRGIIQSTPMGVHMYTLDPVGELIFTGSNPAADEILGLDHEALVGLPILQAFPGLKGRDIPAKYRQVAREGGEWRAEEVLYQDKRLQGVFEVYAFQSEPGKVVVMFNEITERRRAEEELRQLSEFNQGIIQNMAEGLVVEDAQGQITFVNPAAAEMLGYEREDIKGQDWRMVIPPDQHVIVEAANERRRRGDADRYQLHLLHKDGTRIPVLVSGSPIIIGEEFQGTMAVFTDITLIKQREREHEAIVTVSAALRSASSRETMLPIILQQLAFLLRADGAAVLLNGEQDGQVRIEAAIGHWRDWRGVRGKPSVDLCFHPSKIHRPVIREKAVDLIPIIGSDLRSGLSELICVPLVSQDDVLGGVLVGRSEKFDTTEIRILTAIADMAANALRRASLMETLEIRVAERTRDLQVAYEQLKELDELKSEFVSNVSHELRTPITNILLYLDLVQRPEKTEKQEAYFEILERESGRLKHLIEDLLTLSRLEREPEERQLEPVELTSLLDHVLTAHTARAKAKGLAVEQDMDEDARQVIADRQQLEQVFTNLIDNAIAYTPEGGEVRISSWLKRDEQADQLAVAIANSAPAIPEEEIPQLFDRFFRGVTGRESGEPGTGLGLAICKEIVERHQGRLEVESSPEKGTIFTVWLPFRSAGRGKPTGIPDSASPLTREG